MIYRLWINTSDREARLVKRCGVALALRPTVECALVSIKAWRSPCLLPLSKHHRASSLRIRRSRPAQRRWGGGKLIPAASPQSKQTHAVGALCSQLHQVIKGNVFLLGTTWVCDNVHFRGDSGAGISSHSVWDFLHKERNQHDSILAQFLNK